MSNTSLPRASGDRLVTLHSGRPIAIATQTQLVAAQFGLQS